LLELATGAGNRAPLRGTPAPTWSLGSIETSLPCVRLSGTNRPCPSQSGVASPAPSPESMADPTVGGEIKLDCAPWALMGARGRGRVGNAIRPPARRVSTPTRGVGSRRAPAREESLVEQESTQRVRDLIAAIGRRRSVVFPMKSYTECPVHDTYCEFFWRSGDPSSITFSYRGPRF